MIAIESQRQFAARIRDPEAVERLPGISPERMAIYEGLFFRNIEGFLASGFPVLRKLILDARWHSLVRSFIASHRCRSPYFLEISQEFIDWLQEGYAAEVGDPAFILELAHYERVELALDIADVTLPMAGPARLDLLAQPAQWSALAWPLAYQWPVHQLGVDYQPAEPPSQPTCLLVWRDRTHKVRFMQLTGFAYRLATGLQEGEAMLPLLHELARQSGQVVDQAFMDQANALLSQWRAQDILL
tara:strand:- start:7042 stop:7773 length:732 start_codon:yes stop_codon:yes gene_type:complete